MGANLRVNYHFPSPVQKEKQTAVSVSGAVTVMSWFALVLGSNEYDTSHSFLWISDLPKFLPRVEKQNDHLLFNISDFGTSVLCLLPLPSHSLYGCTQSVSTWENSVRLDSQCQGHILCPLPPSLLTFTGMLLLSL